MTDYEAKALRQELETLSSQLAELKATQSQDRADFIKAFNELDENFLRAITDLKAAQNNDRDEATKAISDIYDHLWPVIHKIFPKYAEINRQIDDVIKRHGKSDAEGRRDYALLLW